MHYPSYQNGWIEVICGPMFAGKTEELIRLTKRLVYAKKQFLIFKPQIDNRYGNDEIVSHSNLRANSININKAYDILQYIKPTLDAVIIDEIQFLDEEIILVVDKIANQGIRTICAGLDTDFRGEPFGIMPKLLAKAEFVTKLTAICSVCGLPASKTQRIINGNPAKLDDPIIMVGAQDSYEPRCRKCHQVIK